MATDQVRDSTAAELFGQDDLVVFAISSAVARFRAELLRAQQLLVTATEDERKHNKPTSLRQLGSDLDRSIRESVEIAAERLAATVGDEFAEVLDQAAAESTPATPGKRFHPVAPEQVVAFMIWRVGPSKISTSFAELMAVCGDNDVAARYAVDFLAWLHSGFASDFLARAILPTVVASFEDLLAAALRLWLTLYPRALAVGEGDIKIENATSYASTDDIMRWAVDKRVNDIVDGGPPAWQKVLHKHLKIDVSDLTDCWATFCEVIARRNIVIHAGARVDQKYLESLPPAVEPPALGAFLQSDSAYLTMALAAAERLGTSLAVAMALHLTSGTSRAINLASDSVIGALEASWWHEARDMASRALSRAPIDHDHHELRVNLWMARQEIGEDVDGIRAEIAKWEPPAGEPRYRLAKAALLHDEAGTIAALNAMGQDLTKVRTWPLVHRMVPRSARVATIVRTAAHRGQGFAQPPAVTRRRRR